LAISTRTKLRASTGKSCLHSAMKQVVTAAFGPKVRVADARLHLGIAGDLGHGAPGPRASCPWRRLVGEAEHGFRIRASAMVADSATDLALELVEHVGGRLGVDLAAAGSFSAPDTASAATCSPQGFLGAQYMLVDLCARARDDCGRPLGLAWAFALPRAAARRAFRPRR